MTHCVHVDAPCRLLYARIFLPYPHFIRHVSLVLSKDNWVLFIEMKMTLYFDITSLKCVLIDKRFFFLPARDIRSVVEMLSNGHLI